MKNIPIRHLNTTRKEPDFSENFSIRNVQDLLAGKDMVQELHRHDFFFILALKKGIGNHEIDFISHEICDRSVSFMRPGQVHQLTLKAKSTGYLIAFKTDFYYSHDKSTNQLLRKVSYKNLCQMDANAFKKLLAILSYIFKEYTSKQERHQEVIKANLDIFFIELLRHQPNRKSPSTEAKRASLAERNFQPQTSNLEPNNVNTYTQERLEEFLELLETHISSHKLVSQYADMLSLSNYQLNAITKATLGKTCSEVIDEHIILESKRHLLATSNQVTQVAYHLGYEDVSYFIRFFKKHTGYSPEAFRNNFR